MVNLKFNYVGHNNPKVDEVIYIENIVWVDKAKSCGFANVSTNVWNFHIVGCQICEKWLKDNHGEMLTNEDIVHYQKIVVAIQETIRLMSEIDEVIEKHGSWPI